MTVRYLFFGLALVSLFGACKAEQPVVQKKPVPVMVVKQKHAVLTGEQRRELGFPADIIAKMELAAGAEAEPFYAIVVTHSENLKGEQGFESKKLAGFSVRMKKGDELIDSYRSVLRTQGYLIFRSHKGYGSLADIVSIIKGNNSYDILKVQRTEAQSYQIETQAIIAWLKALQHEGTFVVTGAGPDWLEAKFVKPPQHMLPFAKKVMAFAPDGLQGLRTAEKLAAQMEKNNGFYLLWD